MFQDGAHINVSGAVECGIYIYIYMASNMLNYVSNVLNHMLATLNHATNMLKHTKNVLNYTSIMLEMS